MAIVDISDQTFEKEVAEGTVLVDFWAPWCGPCKMISPVLQEIDSEIGDKIRIKKLNVDENPDMTTHFGVMGIPTLILFKDGNIVEKFSGFRPKEQLLSILNNHI